MKITVMPHIKTFDNFEKQNFTLEVLEDYLLELWKVPEIIYKNTFSAKIRVRETYEKEGQNRGLLIVNNEPELRQKKQK